VLWHARGWACGRQAVPSLIMFVGMARMAESNQVHIGIVAALTAHLLVMNL